MGNCIELNLEILERIQSKVLRTVTDAPRYVPNTIKVIYKYQRSNKMHENSVQNTAKRLDTHPNNLANTLFTEQFGTHRLKRLYPTDLATNG